MEGNKEINEKAYTTSEIAAMLDMGVTTVRKYAQHLEKAGYEFFKTKHNARLFVEQDITALTYMKDLRNKTNITVDQVTKVVIDKIGISSSEQILPADATSLPVYQENAGRHQNKHHEELKELIYRQNNLIEELIQRLDKHQESINERLNERDKSLMRTINERLEAQKQIAATLEDNKEKEQRTVFQKLFKKV
ncbi:MerR family transcriptional regulator [Oceanobacillus bengalensis]|uniref:Uncharacterized protein n=1 Tax=Oceanobacillus bengalensis TaxID=1435466 RepID=A0A494YXQ5_9BACI|nr:MerR family transcriptional regulator [Oceanobacillus bengalensis]RKQ14903.1 hypothetical protein D8M05_11605 [Oceanobacillus bengalensis]